MAPIISPDYLKELYGQSYLNEFSCGILNHPSLVHLPLDVEGMMVYGLVLDRIKRSFPPIYGELQEKSSIYEVFNTLGTSEFPWNFGNSILESSNGFKLINSLRKMQEKRREKRHQSLREDYLLLDTAINPNRAKRNLEARLMIADGQSLQKFDEDIRSLYDFSQHYSDLVIRLAQMLSSGHEHYKQFYAEKVSKLQSPKKRKQSSRYDQPSLF